MSNLTAIKIKLQGLITEREGMIAENMQRQACNESMAYTEEEFIELQHRFDDLLNEYNRMKVN